MQRRKIGTTALERNRRKKKRDPAASWCVASDKLLKGSTKLLGLYIKLVRRCRLGDGPLDTLLHYFVPPSRRGQFAAVTAETMGHSLEDTDVRGHSVSRAKRLASPYHSTGTQEQAKLEVKTYPASVSIWA